MMFERLSYFREYRRARKASGTWKKEWRTRGSKGNVKEQQRRHREKTKGIPRVRTAEYKAKNRNQQRKRRVSEVTREYAVKLLTQNTHLKAGNLPKCLIEAKQVEVKLKRRLRNGDYIKTENIG